MLRFRPGSIHVPHRKNTAEMPAVRMAPPATVLIPMAMHIGAPATPMVKPGDPVSVGTLIGESAGYVSAPVHASVSGTVKKIDTFLTPQGKSVPAVLIESDGEMTPDPTVVPPQVDTLDDLLNAVRASGLVGLGGAGFPAAVKLDAVKKGGIDTILINAAECEPYITADTRTMLDETGDIASAVATLERFLPTQRILFGIEENKPACIARIRETFDGDARVAVSPLPSTYPQGGEKILIYHTLGRIVPEGKLPADVGVIVLNVTSLAFIGRYLRTGMPLTEKTLTVDGSAIASPMNVTVPIGTSLSDVIAFAGGFSEEPCKVLCGGPMMGSAVWSLDTPVQKNTNAIIAMTAREAKGKPTRPCIHCGRCVAACPMGLNPTVYAKAQKITDPAERAARLTEGKLMLCMECGCCSYVCPSARPLVETNKLCKAALREYTAHAASLKK